MRCIKIISLMLIAISLTGCLLSGCGDPTIQIAGKYFNGNQEPAKIETPTSQPMILPTIPAIIAEPTIAVEPEFWGNQEIAAASVLGLAAITYGIRKFIKRKV